ncbi:MAG: hypothetical protein ACJ73D_04385, partial [Pyrinomonadaceae bacterium]
MERYFERWRYQLLFGVETIGGLLLIVNGLPIYRKILYEPSTQIQQPLTLVWTVSAAVLIQIGYWSRYRGGAPVLRYENVLLGHIVVFLSRLSFVFASSAFGYVFITSNIDLEVSGIRYLIF